MVTDAVANSIHDVIALNRHTNRNGMMHSLRTCSVNPRQGESAVRPNRTEHDRTEQNRTAVLFVLVERREGSPGSRSAT